jgi:hypothetical protein
MRSDGFTAADWAVVTEYMDVLKPLKAATKRLEGRGSGGNFGAIAKIIPVFEYISNHYEQHIKAYEAVDYNIHHEAPGDHLAINLRAAWAKSSEYYARLEDSLAYYAATILYLYYKTYRDVAWSDHPNWLADNNSNFRACGLSTIPHRALQGAQSCCQTTWTTRSTASTTRAPPPTKTQRRMSMKGGNTASRALRKVPNTPTTILVTG